MPQKLLALLYRPLGLGAGRGARPTKSIRLSEREVQDLVAFLGTLSAITECVPTGE